jgi:hypothetical protein
MFVELEDVGLLDVAEVGPGELKVRNTELKDPGVGELEIGVFGPECDPEIRDRWVVVEVKLHHVELIAEVALKQAIGLEVGPNVVPLF